MQSLKRSRNELSLQGREPKRTCSNPIRKASIFRDPFNPPIINRRRSRDAPTYCAHKTSSSCSLSLPVCCACADKRPQSSTYLRYVDGKGDAHYGTRDMGYCPGCQAYGIGNRYEILARPSERSLPSCEVDITAQKIRATCTNQTFEFLRSEDLTLEELRNKVAQLMWCNPTHLAVVATDMDLDTGVQSTKVDPALFSSCVKHVHFRLVYDIASGEDDKDDVEMEDVGC
ncbi:hypothetical protein IQ07DRAFT_599999 [Pyrenochaeta sp. DS3sAY3a]|nr:hypothetical protein IQ07DRAFT_599999 [Pyrenochaeta sp. DS3sAY3a]